MYSSCNFRRWVPAANSHVGQVQVITDLTSALWKVNLMLELNRSLSKRDDFGRGFIGFYIALTTDSMSEES
jgi:hypothetical protein